MEQRGKGSGSSGSRGDAGRGGKGSSGAGRGTGGRGGAKGAGGASRGTGGRGGSGSSTRKSAGGSQATGGRDSASRGRSGAGGPGRGAPRPERGGTIGTSRRKQPAPAAPEFRDTTGSKRSKGSDGPREAAPLRVVRGKRGSGRTAAAGGSGRPKPASRRKRHQGPMSVRDEILRHGGAKGSRWYEAMTKASEAFADDRERDAIRILRPVRNALPDAPSVRELMGVALYRSGQYRAAMEELEAYYQMTGEVDQHPVLMDCARALGDPDRVDELWRELAEVSPTAALVTEGRIVRAGSLADRGRLADAVEVLSRRATATPKRIQDHHLRLWYALADLEERSGNLPRARNLFDRIRRHDSSFADVAERLAALG